MIDNGEIDDKLIAVPDDDRDFDSFNSLNDIP